MDLNNKYFVVGFLEKPYSTVDSEVCVPFKWVKLSKTSDTVSVAYPAEYSPSTRGMVRNISKKRDEWHYYKVEVKCGKQSFEAAERYIKSRNQINTESEKTECSNMDFNENRSAFNINSSSSNQCVSPSRATKDLILRNKRNDPVTLSIKRTRPNISVKDLLKQQTKTVKTSELISKTPNHSNSSATNFTENKLVSLDLDCLNPEQHDTTGKQSLLTQDQFMREQRHQEKHIGKQSKLNYTEKSIYFQNDTNNETTSVQSTPNINQPNIKSCKKNHLRAYEQDRQEEFSSNSEEFSDQEMPTEEIAGEKRSENNHNKITTCPEMNTEQDLSASIYTSSQLISIAEVCILKVIQKTFEDICNQSTATDEFSVNRNTFGQLKEAMLQEIDRCLTELQNNISESESQEPPVKAEEKSAKKLNTKSDLNLDLNYVADDSDDDDGHNGDSNESDKRKDVINENDDGLCEPPKKKRAKKRSFVLPPEYNAHDSRWTLKYQAIEPGVVKLVPRSKIYISDIKLANCKRVAKDYNTFGRKLLVEIFSRNALSVCSLTGARANAFDVYDSDIRPGLDKEARSVLFNYVQLYGCKQAWGKFDSQSVVNSVRSKIQEIRSKYGSTV